MRITIQHYSSPVNGGAATLSGPMILADEKAGITLPDFRINGRKLVQAMDGVRAREIIYFGRRNRSTTISFIAEEKLNTPAAAGAKLVVWQSALGELSDYQVLTLTFEWGGSSYVRYCGGSMTEVDGGFIVGCAIRQSYSFAGGLLSATIPPFPSNR